MKMSKSFHRIILASCGFAALLMSGCATTKGNVTLSNAREIFNNVQSDPNVHKYAPLELQEAKSAIEKAESSLASGAQTSQVDHLAYIAKQKAAIADEVAAMKRTDKELESASAERNKALLIGRTREAEDSYNKAEMARQEAENQRRTAEEALKEAQQKALEAETARQEAMAAEARAKKLEAEIAELQASKTERGLVLTLGDVLFDTGKSDLKAGAYATIEKLASFLNEYPTRKIQIEGFTDSVGSEEYNLGLSMHRAEAVRNALNGRGIATDRILYRGYGEMYPIASNDTAAGRQRNRRVEIIISDENGVISERSR